MSTGAARAATAKRAMVLKNFILTGWRTGAEEKRLKECLEAGRLLLDELKNWDGEDEDLYILARRSSILHYCAPASSDVRCL